MSEGAAVIELGPARAPLPAAPELTFVFTDIERSTQLLERLGGRYGDILATPGAPSTTVTATLAANLRLLAMAW